MTVPNPALDRRLAAAAELRAAGNSWEAVATCLRCKAATCRRWPVRYRLRWREVYAAAAILEGRAVQIDVFGTSDGSYVLVVTDATSCEQVFSQPV